MGSKNPHTRKTTTVWLYLGRRDKKGVKILTVLTGEAQSPVRLPDISILQLPPAVERELKSIIHDNRMLWEPWLESADNYANLSDSLRKRGFTQIPLNERPICSKSNSLTPHKVQTKTLPKERVMTQRQSRRRT